MSSSTLCDQLRGAFAGALQGIDVRERVQRALEHVADPGSCDVLAVGKAAPLMLDGALLQLGDRIRRALLVTTDGTPCHFLDDRITTLHASHPVPDHRSALAATTALAFASSCTSARLLVLVSGGTSSLLCAPLGATLDDYRSLTSELLSGGASILEVNVVRRHLSAVHGGRLAAAASVPVRTLIVSDVIGGGAHDVGSGPASVDPTTRRDAQDVLRRYLPLDRASCWVARLRDTPKPGSDVSTHVVSEVILGPEDLADAMARELGVRGFMCTVETIESARADQLLARLIEAAARLAPREGLVVSCEPTLRLPAAPGQGGRAGWVALSALSQLPRGTALLAGASDGVDGSSGAGGACVSAELAADIDDARISLALRARDDAAIHGELGTHLPGVPTGLNLTDVYAVLRA